MEQLRLGRAVSAVESLLQCATANSGSAQAQASMGVLFLRINRPQDALEFLERAAELEELEPARWEALALAAARAGLYDRSVVAHERALELRLRLEAGSWRVTLFAAADAPAEDQAWIAEEGAGVRALMQGLLQAYQAARMLPSANALFKVGRGAAAQGSEGRGGDGATAARMAQGLDGREQCIARRDALYLSRMSSVTPSSAALRLPPTQIESKLNPEDAVLQGRFVDFSMGIGLVEQGTLAALESLQTQHGLVRRAGEGRHSRGEESATGKGRHCRPSLSSPSALVLALAHPLILPQLYPEDDAYGAVMRSSLLMLASGIDSHIVHLARNILGALEIEELKIIGGNCGLNLDHLFSSVTVSAAEVKRIFDAYVLAAEGGYGGVDGGGGGWLFFCVRCVPFEQVNPR